MAYPGFRDAAFGALIVICLPWRSADALEARTYVSTSGSDISSCNSPTIPCHTLSAALTKVEAGGVVTVLDTVLTGTANITKSVTVVAVGGNQMQFLSATHPSPGLPDAAIHITAGADDVVVLDGLSLKGFGDGIRGIRFDSGARLHVRNSVISGYPGGIGIDVQTSGPSDVIVSDCTISETRDAINVRPKGNDAIKVLLDHVTLQANSRDGVRASGNNAVVRINNSRITNNGVGIHALNGASIVSFGNNVLIGNGTNGQPTDTAPLR